jgi:hypothetical protein
MNAKQGSARRERGYAMLSLLAAMTLLVIVLTAAVEPVRHRMQREKEEEMLWRGTQVAAAVWNYHAIRAGGAGGADLNPAFLPTKLEDLAEAYDINGQKQYLVRPSALRDPMTGDGEWKAVRIGDPLVGELYRAYEKYVAEQSRRGGGAGEQLIRLNATLDLLRKAAIMSGVQIKGPAGNQSGDGADDSAPSDSALRPGSAFSLNPESRPIIGVVSRSKEKLIRNYFGLESYDRAMFFPGVSTSNVVVVFGFGGISAQVPPGFTPAPSKIGELCRCGRDQTTGRCLC